MVLTTAAPSPHHHVASSAVGVGRFGSPPKRGATLPPKIEGSSSAGGYSSLNGGFGNVGGHVRSGRAHTLPTHVQTLNQMNSQRSRADFPIVSRNAPAHVSILSLPTSDNEALNFDNR